MIGFRFQGVGFRDEERIDMNIKNYKSGIYKQQYKYKSFSPSKINQTFTWNDPQINTMLEEATRVLGELNAFTMIVPDVDIFIQMHITKEANTSSKIEGTKTEISATDVSQVLDISKPTANNLIKEFKKQNILVEITGYQRNKMYAFDRYLEIYSKS